MEEWKANEKVDQNFCIHVNAPTHTLVVLFNASICNQQTHAQIK